MSVMTLGDDAASVTRLIEESAQRVNRALQQILERHPGPDQQLTESMRYALLGGGKRLRPTLCYATGQVLGIGPERLDPCAAAVEMVHAYSLIHDDLPAMDDDDLRRGRPTVHKAFDEATAILAGDALQTLAFQTLATTGEARAAALVAALAKGSGNEGMAAGQALDLAAVGHDISLEQLIRIHRHKTGALIIAAVELAALLVLEEGDQRLNDLRTYGAAVGLAFQIQDDVLDVVGDASVTGKTQGADAERDKPTYPVLLGLENAAQRARALVDDACDALASFGARAASLKSLARFMVNRDH